MDEFSNMIYRGIENMFNKAGGGGFYLTAATQSIADFDAEVGEAIARKITDNTNTKIFMRVNDLTTAQNLAAYGGLKKKLSPMLSSTGSVTSRETEEDILQPTDFMNLRAREFYYFGFEGQFFCKSAPIAPAEMKAKLADEVDVKVEENPLEDIEKLLREESEQEIERIKAEEAIR
jgi:hypothetical protein